MISKSELKQIRKQHDRYVELRNLFSKMHGILTPIRCIEYRADLSKGLYLANQIVGDLYNKTDEQLFGNSRIIGYLAACRDDELDGHVGTGYSLCAVDDGINFDSEYGKLIAIERAIANATSEVVDDRSTIYDKCLTSKVRLKYASSHEYCWLFNTTLHDQVMDFQARCFKYFKIRLS